eukprot:7066030-Alexandrium_andersonii.AAC.1
MSGRNSEHGWTCHTATLNCDAPPLPPPRGRLFDPCLVADATTDDDLLSAACALGFGRATSRFACLQGGEAP